MQNHGFQYVMRICGDNPFIHVGSIQRLLDEFGKKDYLRTEIITGNSERMRQIVHDFLDEHDFKYVVTEWNMGRTVIVG